MVKIQMKLNLRVYIMLTSICLHVMFFNHFANTLEHTLIFMKYMVNEHVFMNLVLLSKTLSPCSC